jgi:hypothetical protein
MGGSGGFEEAAEEAAVLDDAADDFVGGFLDENAFAGGEGEEGVGGGFDEFDEVGVDHEGLVVEFGEANHGQTPEVRRQKTEDPPEGGTTNCRLKPGLQTY